MIHSVDSPFLTVRVHTLRSCKEARHIHNTPGTGLARRFIRQGRGEDSAYFKDYKDMKQFVDVR